MEMSGSRRQHARSQISPPRSALSAGPLPSAPSQGQVRLVERGKDGQLPCWASQPVDWGGEQASQLAAVEGAKAKCPQSLLGQNSSLPTACFLRLCPAMVLCEVLQPLLSTSKEVALQATTIPARWGGLGHKDGRGVQAQGAAHPHGATMVQRVQKHRVEGHSRTKM